MVTIPELKTHPITLKNQFYSQLEQPEILSLSKDLTRSKSVEAHRNIPSTAGAITKDAEADI